MRKPLLLYLEALVVGAAVLLAVALAKDEWFDTDGGAVSVGVSGSCPGAACSTFDRVQASAVSALCLASIAAAGGLAVLLRDSLHTVVTETALLLVVLAAFVSSCVSFFSANQWQEDANNEGASLDFAVSFYLVFLATVLLGKAFFTALVVRAVAARRKKRLEQQDALFRRPQYYGAAEGEHAASELLR